MSDRNTFAPQSRQFNERLITRIQQNFSDGMWRDATKLSDNAVADLVDMISKGEYLETSVGSRQWGDWVNGTAHATLPTKATGYSLTKSGTTVTKTTGTDFASSNVGDYIVYDDGQHERITAYISTSQVTVHTSTAHSASTNASIRAQVNAIYFHKTQRKILLHIGTEVYIASNIFMGTWNKCYPVSYKQPSNAISMFEEFEDYVYLFNSNGIFKFDLNDSNRYYYQINTPIPSVKITHSNNSDADPETPSNTTSYPYGYKYIYSMSRIAGNGVRNRQTEGCYISQESGTNSITSSLIDYGVLWRAKAVGDINQSGYTDYTVGELTCPVDGVDLTQQKHWSHYSVYRTKDIGTNGKDSVTGEGNNSELFVWVYDVPIAKAFYISTVTQIGSTTTYNVTATSGTFEKCDVGNTLKFDDGTSYTISTYVSSTAVRISNGATKSNIGACIGGGVVSVVASQSSTEITLEDAILLSAHDGCTVFWSDGTTSYIDSITSTTKMVVLLSDDKTGLACTIAPVSRKYTDYVTDGELQSRINFAYTCNQRFWEPLPNVNIGAIVPAFMIVAQRGSGTIYYSQMPQGFEYITGYYYAPFQYIRLKDDIEYFTEHQDKLVVWCRNSIHAIPANTFESRQDTILGLEYSVLTGKYVISNFLGVFDYGGFCYLEDGSVAVITNEPGLRIFDGEKFSENLLEDKIMMELKTWQRGYAMTYDTVNGITFWGLV